MAQPPISARLTSNSRYRIKDAGPRNREENDVRRERCGPSHNADEELCNQVQCTESFPLLEDGVKRRKPAPSTVAVGWGLDCLPANGSLSRAAAMAHSAVRGDITGTIDRESPLVLHSIFRRTLGSRISSVKVRQAGRNGYRKSLNAHLTPTQQAPQARHQLG